MIKKLTGTRPAFILCGFLSAILFLTGLISPFFIDCSGSSSPHEVVDAFFSALSAGDYDAADSYLYEHTTLGLSGESEEAEGRDIAELLRASRNIHRPSESIVNGSAATVEIELTTVDFRILRNELNSRMAELNLTGELAARDASQLILADILQQPEDCYNKIPLNIYLKKQGGMWKIEVTGELYAALTGYAASYGDLS